MHSNFQIDNNRSGDNLFFSNIIRSQTETANTLHNELNKLPTTYLPLDMIYELNSRKRECRHNSTHIDVYCIVGLN